jgi:hypothetical protein
MERHIEQRKLFDSSEENMTNSMPLCMLSEIEPLYIKKITQKMHIKKVVLLYN